MYRDKITLQHAMSLESLGDITIVDCSPDSVPVYKDHGQKWRDAFTSLRKKFRHVNTNSLLNFVGAKYVVEIKEGLQDSDTNTFSWRYMYGITNSSILAKDTTNIEYVYILTNPGYPSLVKIGMTTDKVSTRVRAINATGTVDEWQAKFALPVSKGKALQVEQAVHKALAQFRVSSDLGNSREFFEVSPISAFDKVREVAALFAVGDPIVY